MIKSILEVLAIILILLFFGPIIIICACIGKIPLSMIDERLDDILLNGRTVRVSVALVGVVAWILAVYFVISLFPNLAITPTDSLTPTPECRLDNLLNCSDPGPIFVPEESHLTYTLTPEGLEVDFGNDKNGSGVFFKFSPALDVREFSHLELCGIATRTFTFQVEYKVLVGSQPKIVTTSNQQLFPRTSHPQTVEIPLQYDGTIDQMVINFPVNGDYSLLTIDSIRLK